MRNFLALIGLLFMIFIGAGWYLGWYKVNKIGTEEGESTVNLQVYPSKVGNDTKQFLQKVGDAAEQVRNASSSNPAPASAPPPTVSIFGTPIPTRRPESAASQPNQMSVPVNPQSHDTTEPNVPILPRPNTSKPTLPPAPNRIPTGMQNPGGPAKFPPLPPPQQPIWFVPPR